MAKASKKRNPQDSTRRNVQAANKRWADHEHRIRVLEVGLAVLEDRMTRKADKKR